MISGFSSFLNQEFKIQPILGSIIIIILCYRIFMKNINGIIKVSNYLIPVLIFFLIIISCKNLDFINNYNSIFKNNYNSVFIYNNFYIIALIKSILYASYNTILLIPVLVNLSNIVKNKNCVLNISLSSFFALILLCFCVYNLLLLGNNYIFNLEMPIIEIVEKYSDICKFFYIFMIGISIFTTAISTGFSFLNNISNNKKTYRRNLIFISVSAIILSQISFSILVNLIYPVLGFVGIFEIILLLKNK